MAINVGDKPMYYQWNISKKIKVSNGINLKILEKEKQTKPD